MTENNTKVFERLMEERKYVPFARREILLIVLWPLYIMPLDGDRLNGEGYKLKCNQYWNLVILRNIIGLILTLTVAFCMR